jgi:hypothetical protein
VSPGLNPPTTTDAGPTMKPAAATDTATARTTPLFRRNLPPVIIAAAVSFGLVCGAFEITNTSIGWHLASGRWMLEHHQILDHDVFSFTSNGAEWVDHEWLFQVVSAALFDLGGAPALVAMRMLIIAALMFLMVRIGTTSGLDPPVALLLAALVILGARPRFFLRPELFTLLLLPLAMWLFAHRRGRRFWPLPLITVITLGANLHGAILVAPILISVWFAGEILDQRIKGQTDRSMLSSGAMGVCAAFLAPLLNPHGWLLWAVPFRLAEMVKQPHIPNPEWISPGPADAPALFAAFVLAAMVLIAGRAAPQNWFSSFATAALAVKHIRNIGLFFVLLPQNVAPALARSPLFAADGEPARSRPRVRLVFSLALVGVLGVSAILRPWPRAGFEFAENWYPERAVRFLAGEHLLEGNLYNDVRFGGWLILDGFPDRQVFLDDRNEIHEGLLREIWEILARSDVAAWEDLLERWRIDTILLRYHEPIAVTTPDGADLGRRGFSTLWFPSSRWATVYWDDVAIVLVRRSSVPEVFLSEHEYLAVHPDDFEHLTEVLRTDPELHDAVKAELRRALRENPDCRRAFDLVVFLESLSEL